MRTAQEQELINKLAHNILDVTTEDAQAITREMLNSKINDGSNISESSVAFVLAWSTDGCDILAANSNFLGLQISAETLNAIIEEGRYVGLSVAFALAYSEAGCEILAANGNMLGLQINAETLNAVIQQRPYIGQCVAFAFASSSRGRAILAANNHALALRISVATLNTIIPQGFDAGMSVASALRETADGYSMLTAINTWHKNNNVMLALYSSKVERLGKRSKIRMLQNELLGNVLAMLDGRTPQRLSLK